MLNDNIKQIYLHIERQIKQLWKCTVQINCDTEKMVLFFLGKQYTYISFTFCVLSSKINLSPDKFNGTMITNIDHSLSVY